MSNGVQVEMPPIDINFKRDGSFGFNDTDGFSHWMPSKRGLLLLITRVPHPPTVLERTFYAGITGSRNTDPRPATVEFVKTASGDLAVRNTLNGIIMRFRRSDRLVHGRAGRT